MDKEIREWCLRHQNPIRPSDLQREFRLGYHQAARALEGLERDLVLRRLQNGTYTSQPERARRPDGRIWRDTSRLRKDRHEAERCEVCGWAIPPDLRGRKRASGCHGHHVVPVSEGGSDAPENRVLLCPNHHTLAHALFPRAGGYTGPNDRKELLAALRLAEGSEDFTLTRCHLATATLERVRPEPRLPDPPEPSPLPPPRPRLLPRPSTDLIYHHLRQQHDGPVFDCQDCANLHANGTWTKVRRVS